MGYISILCFKSILIIYFGNAVEATCTELTKDVHSFGENCDFMCHCKNNTACDHVTGECMVGCETGWFGPGCQYRNLATLGDAKHSDNARKMKFAKLAIDDNKNTCSKTAIPGAPTEKLNTLNARFWKVLFKDRIKELITEVIIRTTTQALGYFSNFKVYVENASINETGRFKVPKDRKLCHHGQDKPKSTTIHVICNMPIFGNQIRIQTANLDTQLVLCEVTISGGRNLAFRREVTTSTMHSDPQHANVSVDGSRNKVPHHEVCSLIEATQGQNQWWRIDLRHPSQLYSMYMYTHNNETLMMYTITVSNSSDDEIVAFEDNDGNTNTLNASFNTTGQHVTISTIDTVQSYANIWFCEVEIYGDCPKDMCGFDCNTECHCKDERVSLLDKMASVCHSGCSERSASPKCEQVCSDVDWGVACNNSCGQCVEPCNVTTGKCENDCIAGYFGEQCLQECLHCKNKECFKVNGNCFEGCEPGYMGDDCTEECDMGYYGNNCTETCTHCAGELMECNHEDGTCINGCTRGWDGPKCDKRCEFGSYGMDCAERCRCAGEGIDCNKENGTCVEGCQAGWVGPKCNIEEPASGRVSGTASVGAVESIVLVGGGVAAGFLFILTVLLVIIAVVKGIEDRNSLSITDGNDLKSGDSVDNTWKDSYENIIATGIDLDENNIIAETKDHVQNNEGNIIPWMTSTVIQLGDIRTYIDKALTNRTYHIQFLDIPYGLYYPHMAALKSANRQKSRNNDMYAYDHTRVVLKCLPDQPDSDFINASHIRGHMKSNAYIATQGPTDDTFKDFWRLIWEKNITTIVMVTSLVEDTKSQCKKYWEEAGWHVQYGDIIIFTEAEILFAEYTKRQFKVSIQGQPHEERIVTQFQYTAWPDKHVPNNTTGLLDFWYHVRKCDDKKTTPWLVHGSVGAGRTGTFIALDILYDMGKHLGYIDVYQCVKDLRQQRANLVQTEEQFKFLHSVLLEALVLPSKPVHIDEYQKHCREMNEELTQTGITKFHAEYMEMTLDMELLVCCNIDDTFFTAMSPENKDKNRYGRILASDGCRPYLTTLVPGTTDYINAVYMPSLYDKRGFLVTQVPLKNTAVDCCRLLFEEDTKVIVTFDNYDVVEAGQFLPEEGTMQIGPFTMVKLSEQILFDYNIKAYEITYNATTKVITRLEFVKWSIGTKLPENQFSLLNFLIFVERFRKQEVNSRLIVQCQNGADKSGLFVVMMNILEQVMVEKEVSIPQVVRRAKFIRRRIISTYEQYQFCHELLQNFLDTSAANANL